MFRSGATVDTDEVEEVETAARASVDELVRRYEPLAQQLTSLLLTRVPRSVERSELSSAALLGLLQAAQSWEPDRGVTFEAYARHRIRGALLDELRGRDWASRRVRTFARTCATATDQLTGELGRRPTDAEVADRLGVPVAAVEGNLRDVHFATLQSTDALVDDAPGTETDPDDDPQQVLLRREQSGYLFDAVAVLPDRLRHVIVGYYIEERPMQDIADELGVTESRVSQMRGEAVRLLKGALTGALEPDRVGELAFGDHLSERALGMAAALRARSDYRERLDLTLPV